LGFAASSGKIRRAGDGPRAPGRGVAHGTTMTLLQRQLRRLAEPYVFFPLIAIILLAVIWGTTVDVIRVERRVAERTALASTQELADTYEAQVVRAMREIDQTLRLVKFTWERGRGRVDIGELREKGLLLPELLFSMRITDAAGDVVAATHAGGPRNVADQGWFRRAADIDSIVVGVPRMDPAEHEWKVDFSRRLQWPDGSFGGTVVISVAASYFVSGDEPSRLGHLGVLAILGADGVFRARRTGDQLSIGDLADYNDVVRGAQADAAPAVAWNPWDNRERYSVARPLFEFPVAVIVGLDRAEQLAPVEARAREYAWRAAGASLVLTLLLGGLGFLSWRLSRTRILANRALQEEIRVRRGAERALSLRNRAIESSVNAI